MRSPKSFHVFIPFFVLLTLSSFSHAPEVPAQQTAAPPIAGTPVAPAGPAAPAQASQSVSPGSLSPQQIQQGMQAVEKGLISPEAIRQVQEKGGLGTLTPQEIEAGKKLLDQKGKEAPKEALPEQVKAPEKKPEEKAEPKKEEQKPKEPPIAQDEFFKKNAGPETPSLEIFGHRLFSGAPSTFAPITSVPVSNDYVIGPGDEIRVLMWGRLDAYYSLEVDNEGGDQLPQSGTDDGGWPHLRRSQRADQGES